MQASCCYKIPSSQKARERLREKGQFYTPDWIVVPMVEYILRDAPEIVYDPAVGTGNFLREVRHISAKRGFSVDLAGVEIDASTLESAATNGLTHSDLRQIVVGDFIMQPLLRQYPAIVANPPYIRHHRLSAATKSYLRSLACEIIGKPLDGRAGLHVYFLIKALTWLAPNGRLAFIVPADICEGKFAGDLWHWIASRFSIDAIIAFSPCASPFPGVDINPVILLMRNAPPASTFYWAKCQRAGTEILASWVRQGFGECDSPDLFSIRRGLNEGMTTGLSREPGNTLRTKFVLGDFVRVTRGIATGANDFFMMTLDRIRELGLPVDKFTRAIGRTRDIEGDEINAETLSLLEQRKRPTWLLTLDREPVESLPEALKNYLAFGETIELPNRPLISKRSPWYRIEKRRPPPFLFTYLGRRDCRFIRNSANVVPLNSFLCVYPRDDIRIAEDEIWQIISHPDTLANLRRVAKSYGAGALKIEPRMLERLPIPDHVTAFSLDS